MPKFSNQYKKFIRSSDWKKKRAKILKHYGNKCAECGSTKRLECDHQVYPAWDAPIEAFKAQPMKDFVVLCHTCHTCKTKLTRSGKAYCPPQQRRSLMTRLDRLNTKPDLSGMRRA